jgi:hypothetical protein
MIRAESRELYWERMWRERPVNGTYRMSPVWLDNMFYGQRIGKWNVQSVNFMSYMFCDAFGLASGM